jgi:hypothetical protein
MPAKRDQEKMQPWCSDIIELCLQSTCPMQSDEMHGESMVLDGCQA